MIPLTLGEVGRLCPGRLVAAPRAERIGGVQVDSRRIAGGDLFVAVNDAGAEFVDDALERGAAAALVPEDAFAALAALGGAVRDRSTARVVGITGSAGKTSAKDILAAILSPRVCTVAAEASFNNEIGVPLTLCRLERDTEACVLELSMRGLGQIAELCAFARPDVGVITAVGPAHVGLLGSLEAITDAKSELVEALPPGGTAIVPEGFAVVRDDVEVVRLAEPETRVVDGRTLVRWNGREIAFDFTARHQARNALAALHAARALGVEPEESVEVALSRWRGEEAPLAGGGLLINDAYNANPLSMRAALEHLVERAAGRRTVAVLGEMAELGHDSGRYHEEIGQVAKNLGVDVVIGVGDLARGYHPTGWSRDAAAAIEVARDLLRPGDAVLVKGSRAAGLEIVAEALTAVPGVVVRVLIAGVLALLISIAIGPRFIRFLREREYGQQIREEGPSHHAVKQGTPTMGGLLIVVAMAIPFLALGNYTTNSLLVFFVFLSCAAIGFIDDFSKLTRKRSLGLRGRWKLMLLAAITAVVAYVTHHRHFETSVYIPVVNGKLPLSWGWYILLFFIIAGASNGVNLTDGLDGLAAGTGIIAVFTFTAMAVIAWVRSSRVPANRNEIYLDLAIVGAALIGAIVGFLWYNAWPAEVFMGDTGSMGIGGALAAFAIVMKTEFLLLLIGGIFLIEAVSVIIQVFSFKRWGRRVFLMAPIHHHFEMKAWSETKIMVRFWILCAILCALGFALYYRYYFQFFRGH